MPSPSSDRRAADQGDAIAPAGRPSAASSMPLASHAAAGAKRSRPSNVRLTVGRAYRRSVSSTIRLAAMLVEDGGQHAVVGRHERVVAGVGRDAAPRRPDAGIDDDQKNRAGGKILVGGRELERAGRATSCGGDVVRDVDEGDVRADAERDALHRAGVVVARAEVGEQSDDRPGHAFSLSLLAFRSAWSVASAGEAFRKKDLALVVLEQERIRHVEPGNSRRMSRFGMFT